MFDFGEPSALRSSAMLYSANSLYDYVEAIPILLSLNRNYDALICSSEGWIQQRKLLTWRYYWQVHIFMQEQLVNLLISWSVMLSLFLCLKEPTDCYCYKRKNVIWNQVSWFVYVLKKFWMEDLEIFRNCRIYRHHYYYHISDRLLNQQVKQQII